MKTIIWRVINLIGSHSFLASSSDQRSMFPLRETRVEPYGSTWHMHVALIIAAGNSYWNYNYPFCGTYVCVCVDVYMCNMVKAIGHIVSHIFCRQSWSIITIKGLRSNLISIITAERIYTEMNNIEEVNILLFNAT